MHSLLFSVTEYRTTPARHSFLSTSSSTNLVTPSTHQVALNGGDETVSFGPRMETGSALFHIETLATVGPSAQVRHPTHTKETHTDKRETRLFWSTTSYFSQ